ncbi:hypothetical protein GE061_014717 [Apolygus lucorum]|uniref:Uncharacterized protein n=1 Tax=Apolygus lucorum TaxID=248454 RepID=A0A8S9XK80_APOLU|nr:hypothetical protein GE061_014717 [Apolygus lucorum]
MDPSKDCHGNSDEDELDPRIQIELEILNNCTDLINKLEIELDITDNTFNIKTSSLQTGAHDQMMYHTNGS